MTAPTPTPTAVDALAAFMWNRGARYATPLQDVPVDISERVQSMARELLTAVYPQIVADVLDDAADQLAREDRVGTPLWLRARADEVRP
jgi:predicted RecB family endonuclease